MVSFEDLSDAIDNCCVSYPDSHGRIRFKTPGDAFLALIHLRLEVNLDVKELGFQDLINDVRNPRFKAFSKRRWQILLHKLARSDPRNASLITGLTSGSFFASRTFTRISDIDAFIREEKESSIQPYHEATYALPSLVLHLIADFKAGEVDDFMYTMLHLPPRRTPQQDLLSMSLVHKSWTFLFQSRARRIIHLQSYASLQRFVQNPHCGPWIRELYYKPHSPVIPGRRRTTFYTEDEEESRERISDSPLQFELVNHWPLLASLLSLRASNLRFLSISLSAIPRTTDSVGNLLNPRPCRGLLDVVTCIGKFTQLEGLEIDLHDALSHPFLFPNLCVDLAGLVHLRALSIRGFEERSREPASSLVDDMLDRIPIWMCTKSDGPRLELQTLKLCIMGSPREYEWRGLLWILRSLLTLENLIICVKIQETGVGRGPLLGSLRRLIQSSCDQPYPRLRSLRIQLEGEKFMTKFDGAPFVELFASLLRRCTSLSTLFVTYSPTPDLLIPPAVETLYLSYNFSLGENSANSWAHWDLRTVALLDTHIALHSHRALELVVIDLNCEEEFGFCVRDRFPQTIKRCKTVGLAIEFSDEGSKSFDQRMYDSIVRVSP